MAFKNKNGLTRNQQIFCDEWSNPVSTCQLFQACSSPKRLGLPFDISVAALKVWAHKNKPEGGKRMITEQEIISQASDAFSKDYKGFDCQSEAVAPFCQPNCTLLARKEQRNN